MINEYDDILAQLVSKLSPIEQVWFAQTRNMQRVMLELFKCPAWRFFRRAGLHRQLMREVKLCEDLFRQVKANRELGRQR